MNHRLIHDAAFQMAGAILRTVKDCLYEQEHRLAFEEIYGVIKDGIERYEAETVRVEKRLKPSQNGVVA